MNRYRSYTRKHRRASIVGFSWDDFLTEVERETGLRIDPFFWEEPHGVIYALDWNDDEFEIEVAIRPNGTYELISVLRFY